MALRDEVYAIEMEALLVKLTQEQNRRIEAVKLLGRLVNCCHYDPTKHRWIIHEDIAKVANVHHLLSKDI